MCARSYTDTYSHTQVASMEAAQAAQPAAANPMYQSQMSQMNLLMQNPQMAQMVAFMTRSNPSLAQNPPLLMQAITSFLATQQVRGIVV